MSKKISDFQVFTAVRVCDPEYVQFGQVGVFVGAGTEPDEGAVKFEGQNGQEIDTFPLDALEPV